MKNKLSCVPIRRIQRLQASKTVILPSGRELAYVSKDEVSFLYQEIYVEQCYLKHGISIKAGDCILDVGANVGMFSIFAAEAAGPKVFLPSFFFPIAAYGFARQAIQIAILHLLQKASPFVQELFGVPVRYQ